MILSYSNLISRSISTMVFEGNVCGKFGGGVFSINQIIQTPSTGATFAGTVRFLNNTAESGGGVSSLRGYLNFDGEASFKGGKEFV